MRHTAVAGLVCAELMHAQLLLSPLGTLQFTGLILRSMRLFHTHNLKTEWLLAKTPRAMAMAATQASLSSIPRAMPTSLLKRPPSKFSPIEHLQVHWNDYS